MGIFASSKMGLNKFFEGARRRKTLGSRAKTQTPLYNNRVQKHGGFQASSTLRHSDLFKNLADILASQIINPLLAQNNRSICLSIFDFFLKKVKMVANICYFSQNDRTDFQILSFKRINIRVGAIIIVLRYTIKYRTIRYTNLGCCIVNFS